MLNKCAPLDCSASLLHPRDVSQRVHYRAGLLLFLLVGFCTSLTRLAKAKKDLIQFLKGFPLYVFYKSISRHVAGGGVLLLRNVERIFYMGYYFP